MSLLRWSLRCIPGLSTFCLLVLLECALKIVQTEWLRLFYPPFLRQSPAPQVAQGLFIFYSIFLHTLALIFPLRLCASVWAATRAIQATHTRPTSFASDAFRCDSPDQSLHVDQEQNAAKRSGCVTMAVVVPSYKEDIEILETSLRVLASHTLAKSSYDVLKALN